MTCFYATCNLLALKGWIETFLTVMNLKIICRPITTGGAPVDYHSNFIGYSVLRENTIRLRHVLQSCPNVTEEIVGRKKKTVFISGLLKGEYNVPINLKPDSARDNNCIL